MTPEQVLEQLADREPTQLPEEAIRAVMAEPELYMDALLAELARPLEELCEDELPLVHYAYYLCAYHREQRALPLLLKLLSGDQNQVDMLFGDGITEDLPSVMATLCGTDVTPLQELIGNTELDDYTRHIGLEALQILHHVGQLETTELHRIIIEIAEGSFAENIEYLVADTIADEGIESLLPVVEKWFKENKVEAFYFPDLQSFKKQLKEPTRDFSQRKLLDDPVAVASRWPYLCGKKTAEVTEEQAKKLEDAMKALLQGELPNRAEPSTEPRLVHDSNESGTFVHHGPRVGRNDPCPCSSGKKYKKCCGK